MRIASSRLAFILSFVFSALFSVSSLAGQTGSSDGNAGRPCDSSDGGSCQSDSGMPIYSFKSMLAGLSLRDTPLDYTPPVGEAVKFTLFYNQRAQDRARSLSAVNLGSKWTSNWISYIEDNPAVAGGTVFRFVSGGGGEEYSGYNSNTGEFAPHEHQGTVLIRKTSPAVHYELRYNDGRRELFEASDNHPNTRRFYLTQRMDAQGNAVTLSYDNQLRLVQLQDALGQVSHFDYNHAAYPLAITSIRDPFGRSAQMQYDQQGRLTAITDAIGMTSSFSYEGSGTFINSMTTPYGTTTFAQSAGVGSPTQASIQATDPLGYTERTEYRHSAPGIAFSESQVPAGLGITNNYMNYRNSFYWNKHAFAQACTLGGSSQATCDYTQAHLKHFLHNAKGQTASTLESTKAPLESRVWRTYAGQPNSIYTGKLDSPSVIARVLDDGQTQKSQYQYNRLGQITQHIDPEGRTTYYRYASNDIDLIQIQQQGEQGLETLTSLTWNDQHLPLSITDAAGQTSTYTYNERGQLTSARNALGEEIRYQYNAQGYLLRILNALGRTQQQFSYDSAGRVASVTDSEGHTQRFSYDALNRVTRITYPDFSARQITWDKLDVVMVTDREGRQVRYQYDANRNLIKTINELGHETHYRYYPDGRLHTLTDANGNITTWQRDIQGRVIGKTYNDGQGDDFGYDSAGRLTQQSDALGQRTQYRYTRTNQLAQVDYLDSLNPTPSVTFTYDAFFPRLTALTDGQGTTLYRYYRTGELGAGLTKEEANAQGQAVQAFAYDALGRIRSHTVAGSTQTAQYDALGRIAQQQNALGQFTLQYLGDSAQIIAQKQAQIPYQTQIGYENNTQDRRLKSLNHALQEQYTPSLPWPLNWLFTPAPQARDKPVLDLSFKTSAEGRINQRTLSGMPEDKAHLRHGLRHLLLWLHGKNPHKPEHSLNGTTVYQYDAAGHLLSATQNRQEQAGYETDAVDNLVEIRQGQDKLWITPNSLNQIHKIDALTYQYDANGNLLNDGLRSYQWDGADRLIKITDLSNGKTSEFAYDGYSRRVSETEKNANGTIVKTVTNLWCGETLCAQQNANGQITNRFFAQGEVQNGQAYLYAQDQIGSVLAMIDAQGKVAGRAAYDPYGNAIYQQGIQPIMAYAGLYKHNESELHLATYRAYDPATARWLNRDPIQEAGGLNIYAYVGGDPVNAVDPDGKNPLLFIAVGGAVGGLASGVTTYIVTGDAKAARSSAQYGALGGMAAVASAMMAPTTLLGTAAAVIFDTAINAAGHATSVADIMDSNSSSGNFGAPSSTTPSSPAESVPAPNGEQNQTSEACD
ncbi:MAG: RHS repeat-associated core domain-containing protein [Venatoribacter sp.]